MCLLSVQFGGGLYILGTAKLIDSSIYSNEALVSVGNFRTKLDSSAPLERYVCSPFVPLQLGGGLYVRYGTATLTNTNVYENVAAVRLHFEPSWSSAPAPRWNVSCARLLHRLAQAAGSTSMAAQPISTAAMCSRT